MYRIYPPVYNCFTLYEIQEKRDVNNMGVLAGCKYFVPDDSPLKADCFERSSV